MSGGKTGVMDARELMSWPMKTLLCFLSTGSRTKVEPQNWLLHQMEQAPRDKLSVDSLRQMESQAMKNLKHIYSSTGPIVWRVKRVFLAVKVEKALQFPDNISLSRERERERERERIRQTCEPFSLALLVLKASSITFDSSTSRAELLTQANLTRAE